MSAERWVGRFVRHTRFSVYIVLIGVLASALLGSLAGCSRQSDKPVRAAAPAVAPSGLLRRILARTSSLLSLVR